MVMGDSPSHTFSREAVHDAERRESLPPPREETPSPRNAVRVDHLLIYYYWYILNIYILIYIIDNIVLLFKIRFSRHWLSTVFCSRLQTGHVTGFINSDIHLIAYIWAEMIYYMYICIKVVYISNIYICRPQLGEKLRKTVNWIYKYIYIYV